MTNANFDFKNEFSELVAAVASEPPWTEEEARLSCPYSYVRSWERILEGQYLTGRNSFIGPPGMREKVITQIEAEGIEVARERFLNDIMANGELYEHGPIG